MIGCRRALIPHGFCCRPSQEVCRHLVLATLGDCVKEFRRKELLPREMCQVLEVLHA